MDLDDLTRTALTDRHIELGAKLAPFGGWAMPLEYPGEQGGTVAEHHAVRSGAGIFDVSHLGTVWVTGENATAVIASSFSNDATTLEDEQSQYTLCVAEDGGILDDCIVYRLAPDRWMVVPNASNTATVVARLESRADGTGVTVEDVSTEFAILAVQGPRALQIVQDVTGHVAIAQAYLSVVELPVGEGLGWVCRTGYTGEPGCEIVLPNDLARGLFDALLKAGVIPAGLGARDTLRLEMGYPLHGNDIGPDTTPVEARLGWAVKLDRGDFVGRDALLAAKEAGPSRRLFGLRATGRGIPRAGMTVLQGDTELGTVTSGTFSPTLKSGIAMAYLADPIAPGDEVEVDVRGKRIAFEVVRPPFVDRDPKG